MNKKWSSNESQIRIHYCNTAILLLYAMKGAMRSAQVKRTTFANRNKKTLHCKQGPSVESTVAESLEFTFTQHIIKFGR